MTGAALHDLGQRPLIMGIVNVTPDSFSGDGLLLSDDYVSDATNYGLQLVRDGADILDVGGESTRPGAKQISVEEEIRRVKPVIDSLRRVCPDIPLSIDTIKPDVARIAVSAGAAILNDVSGDAQDPDMRKIAAATGAYLVIMHNDANARAVAQNKVIGGEYLAPDKPKEIAGFAQELAELVSLALESGVRRDRIILDPGIGFGKTLEQNLQLINQLDLFKPLGFPLLLGPSRKSFIGRILDAPPGERTEGTAAAVTIGTLRGANILRVHDVRFMSRLVKMTLAITKAGQD
jgi:dihydropteroate synthase